MQRRAVLFTLGLTLAAAGCAAPDASSSPRTGFVLARPLVGASPFEIETPVDRQDRALPHAPVSPALAPDTPWIGSVGLRRYLAGSYEVGVGFCVPNVFDSRSSAASSGPFARDVGLGLWLELDW